MTPSPIPPAPPSIPFSPPPMRLSREVLGYPWAVRVPRLGIWRTCQPDLFGVWGVACQTWPISGLMLAGRVYRLPGLVRAMSGCGFSSWRGPLLRTPLASEAHRGNQSVATVKARRGVISLTTQLAELARTGPALDFDGPWPPERWGVFWGAVARWEQASGRTVPPPVVPTRTGGIHPNPVMVEWMMGLPPGWVTDPGFELSVREQLTLLGNGVVPHQGELALRILADTLASISE
jgi:hypothetical protein